MNRLQLVTQMIRELMIKDKLPEQDKEAIQDLMAFKEITGIDVDADSNKGMIRC